MSHFLKMLICDRTQSPYCANVGTNGCLFSDQGSASVASEQTIFKPELYGASHPGIKLYNTTSNLSLKTSQGKCLVINYFSVKLVVVTLTDGLCLCVLHDHIVRCHSFLL